MSNLGETLYICVGHTGLISFTKNDNVVVHSSLAGARRQCVHLDKKEWDQAPHDVVEYVKLDGFYLDWMKSRIAWLEKRNGELNELLTETIGVAKAAME